MYTMKRATGMLFSSQSFFITKIYWKENHKSSTTSVRDIGAESYHFMDIGQWLSITLDIAYTGLTRD